MFCSTLVHANKCAHFECPQDVHIKIELFTIKFFPMKTSKAFQILTQCVENKWEGYGVPLAERSLIVS